MALHYIVTGAPCTGKSTLAAWLCRRLPQPVTGLRTLCTGRQGDGPRFSVQNLADGTVTPLEHPTDWDTAAAPVLLAALAQGEGTILVDEATPPTATDTPWARALAQVLGSNRPVVLTAAGEGLAEQAVSADPETRCLCLDRTSPQQVRETLARELPAPLHAGASVRLFREEKCFGPGPMELLELVGRTGSLHKAAAAMGMAYSKAWKLLGELERQWGFAMLERRPGGTGGGGSLLTPQAWDLLRRYHALQWETEQAARQAFARWFGDF